MREGPFFKIRCDMTHAFYLPEEAHVNSPHKDARTTLQRGLPCMVTFPPCKMSPRGAYWCCTLLYDTNTQS